MERAEAEVEEIRAAMDDRDAEVGKVNAALRGVMLLMDSFVGAGELEAQFGRKLADMAKDFVAAKNVPYSTGSKDARVKAPKQVFVPIKEERQSPPPPPPSVVPAAVQAVDRLVREAAEQDAVVLEQLAEVRRCPVPRRVSRS